MEFKQCSKGHFYDPSVTDTCPQCAAEAAGGNRFQYDIGATTPASMEDYGATESVSPCDNFFSGGNADMGATMPPMMGGGTGMGETMAPIQGNGFIAGNFPGGGGVEDYSDATQPTIVAGVEGFSPVTGWLVCVDGAAKGTDYRIRAGYNYIGRAEHMDICIAGDNQIGRDRHAMIAYDQEERVFFFGPADGKSIVRLNGKMVMVPSELHTYDIITIGSTKLMFVPLCGERFNWDE